ncbi:hypothetical protein QBC46DRAFT_383338 [Diplogelasinospora grovesii]|uniref:Protein SQS1 n=1 Tax=Diplogelasinospora grovesii TaxID=303347 RepID=A0AAN6S5F8_9PEZI|nr:hypothetical protein QBC46DRAFT_383338 [Diplogelasinospora grovesii]
MRNKRNKRPSAGPKAARLRSSAAQNRTRDIAFPGLTNMAPTGFTMQDEARNTASHKPNWGQDSRLRQKPVTFVSAGFVEPLKETQPSEAQAPVSVQLGDENAEDSEEALEADAAEETDMPVGDLDETMPEIGSQEEGCNKKDDAKVDIGTSGGSSENPDSLFFFDLRGEKRVGKGEHSPPDIPDPRSSPDHSDSSEEVIVFRGRSTISQINNKIVHDPPTSSGKASSSHKKKDHLNHHVETATSDPRVKAQPSIGSNPQQRARSQRSHRRLKKTQEEEEEDEILADYIANMAAQSEDDGLADQKQPFSSRRELGGQHGAFDIGDLDGGAVPLVEYPFNDEVQLDGANESSDTDSDSDLDESAEDGLNGGSEEVDELEGGMDSEVDDETLARLLSKQEELGVGSHELVRCSGSYLEIESSTTSARNLPGAASKAGRGPNRKKGTRASASAVAEAFDDLDLTDWDQPVPWKSGKGRRSKQPPAFNVSDSELDAALRTAWQRDRERKKKRKLEREELRTQGLLGKHANPDDLRVKYRTGMKLDDVKTELTAFLVGTAETIQFPPMDKQARKVLHELASKFKVKSQSTGNGDQRRPVLYRTKHTATYSETRIEEATSHVDQAAVRINRKYFHRIDIKGKAVPKTIAAGGRAGGKAVTYRDGEVVGASVPELGQANRGHAMLEKMGWTKGMALGAEDNKGILEPVRQVVKRSKAGLG